MTLPIEEIPFHLQQFVARQEYDQYTAIDHAAWRYILLLSRSFFKENAHPKYLEGLRETGISIERIPHISEMDEKLRRFGWRAVAVTGFIPPEAFSEMLHLRILPIACDMRKLEHLDYTPAPDIVHEAAGHAPILADQAYAACLAKYGELARYVIFAKEDNDVYQAVLNLSEVKEDPKSTAADVAKAQKDLDEAYLRVQFVSEAQQLSRFGWWTTEYGLYRQGDRYLIYGAGLLSSVGESYSCLSDKIPKRPLTIECINQDYDITKPQPQLYYTDDFETLERVIDELASRMSYKVGGIVGLERAKAARTVTTTVLNSGLQISGVLADFRCDGERVDFIRLTGPVQLSFGGMQLSGHGPAYHKEGYSSPIGRLKHKGISTSELDREVLRELGFSNGQKGRMEFQSGVILEGVLHNVLEKEGRALILTFENCTVRGGDEILYRPEWGPFDLACGDSVVSVFGGAGDRGAFIKESHQRFPKARPQKSNRAGQNERLISLYEDVRRLRERGEWNEGIAKDVERIAQSLRAEAPKDWLLRWEIVELLSGRHDLTQLATALIQELREIAKMTPELTTLIERGLELHEELRRGG